MVRGADVLSREEVAEVVARAVSASFGRDRDLGRQELAVLSEAELLVQDVGEFILAAVDAAYDLGRFATSETPRAKR